MYYLLTRQFPFKFARLKSDQEVYQSLKIQALQFDSPVFSLLNWNEDFKQLIEGLLRKDPSKRLSAK